MRLTWRWRALIAVSGALGGLGVTGHWLGGIAGAILAGAVAEALEAL